MNEKSKPALPTPDELRAAAHEYVGPTFLNDIDITEEMQDKYLEGLMHALEDYATPLLQEAMSMKIELGHVENKLDNANQRISTLELQLEQSKQREAKLVEALRLAVVHVKGNITRMGRELNLERTGAYKIYEHAQGELKLIEETLTNHQ